MKDFIYYFDHKFSRNHPVGTLFAYLVIFIFVAIITLGFSLFLAYLITEYPTLIIIPSILSVVTGIVFCVKAIIDYRRSL